MIAFLGSSGAIKDMKNVKGNKKKSMTASEVLLGKDGKNQ